MTELSFLQKLSKDEFFYISADGALDRLIGSIIFAFWGDYHDLNFLPFLLIVGVLFFNNIIKDRIRLPRLGYANFDKINFKFSSTTFLIFAIIIALNILTDHVIVKMPIVITFTTMYLGKASLVSLILLIGLIVSISYLNNYLYTHIYLGLMVITFLIHTIAQNKLFYSSAILCIAISAILIGFIKLFLFIRRYPLIPQNTEPDISMKGDNL